jgi:hypothetical protein
MKRMLNLLSLVCICLAFSLVNAGWQLVFSDNFDWNGGVDNAKWAFDVGGGGWGI